MFSHTARPKATGKRKQRGGLAEEGLDWLIEFLKAVSAERKGVNSMDEAHKKAQATRERNQEARRQGYAEQAEGIRVARLAIQRVMESEDTTPAEILEAARLLVEIGK